MTVSLGIIAFNEESSLDVLFLDLLQQDFPREDTEIVLVDSLSTDGTLKKMEAFQKQHPEYKRIQIQKNEKKTQPCGWNVVLRSFTGEVLIRLDAHARFHPDFVSKSVACLETGETVCGGVRPCIVENGTPWQNTLLTAENSLFGSSFAPYRRNTKKSYVNSVFHAAYRREVFETVGGFDERLTRTEDNDMHQRIRQAGYKICFDEQIQSNQLIRSSFSKMMRQKYLNGYWIGLTLKINPRCLEPYHFVPFLFVLAILGGLVLGLFGIWWPLIALGIAYGTADLLLTVASVLHKPFSGFFFCLPVLFLLLHLAYGWGTLTGIVKLPFWYAKNKQCEAMEQVKDAMKRQHE